jgi:glutathione synthase/RimK-type ligase-like ATP-grasp enzyme
MRSSVLVVVNDPKDMPLHFEGVELVAARKYLTDSLYADMRGARVFNLCRSYRYQSTGYYVSLLAAARGQKPFPNILTIRDITSQALVRGVSEELEDLIQRSLRPIQSKEFVLSIYFGHNLAKRHDALSSHLFRLFQAPFLRALFLYGEKNKKWHLQNISPIAAGEIPEEHRPFVVNVAHEYFRKSRRNAGRRVPLRYDLAILHNPEEKEPPSDGKALRKFVRAAESLGLAAELIEKDDIGRLAEFDGLFIRETTSVPHHTYRFARRAVAEGVVTIDDPESILKCTNKVFLAELLERHRVRTPKTMIVHRDNVALIPETLGFPCILKRPDSSFSQGVIKVENEDELETHAEKMLDRSDLVIAQEFLSTDYDWRVGIIDREPLYVCKYYMAKKHWQIIKRDSRGLRTEDGPSETYSVEDAPKGVVRAALRAANLIGDGFYGVDVKERDGKLYVIEVNDNPSIDSGVEDSVMGEELYRKIMTVFLRRIEGMKLYKDGAPKT